jgi:hypothetical protein
MALIASIISTFDPRGVNNARKSFAALTDSNVSSSKKQAIAMKLVGGAIAAAGVAATAFALKIGRDGVRAALADEKSLAMLNKTLLNVGEGFRSTAVNTFIDNLQFSTGIADDELRPALNRLLLATGSVTQAQSLLSTALDVSAGTGRDLESVTAALAKAASGQTTALSRLGVGLDKNILKTANLSDIQTALNQKFSGQAVVAANTYAGRLSILSRGADEAQEAIGYGLLDAIFRVNKALGNDATGMAGSLQSAGDSLGNAIRGVGELVARFIELSDESKNAEKSVGGLFATIVKDITSASFAPLISLVDKLIAIGEASRYADYVPKFGTMHQARIARENKKILDKISQDEEARKEAEAEAERKAAEATRERERALKELEAQQKRVNKTSQEFAKFAAGTGPQTVQGATDLATKALTDMKNELGKTRYLTADTADKFDEFSNIVENNFSNALSMATSQLDEAKTAFSDFKNAITGSITGTIDFASAVENTDFLTGLQAQADTALKFSDRVSKLLQMGLSERALQQVLNAGAETGIAIADQIIAGGSTVVTKVNDLLSSVATVADQVGTSGAQLFYSAGVTQGQSLVDGIKASITSAAGEIAALAASLVGATAPVITTASNVVAPSVSPRPGPKVSPLTTTEKIVKAAGGAQSTAASRSYTAMAAAMGKIRLAEGGIVMGPTNALIGEAGPEAVIPLSGINSKLGTTINITVNAGIGTNGAQVGREIVDAIKKYERTSGPVFVSA